MKNIKESIKYMKNSKNGITLVALVVTIVVLLILAGVTITMLVGDNGIIKKAKDAADATKNAQDDTTNRLANLVELLANTLGENTTVEPPTPPPTPTPIDTTKSYVGYYADIEGDGTVDGVIYADLAKGNTKSGTWSTTNTSTYTIPKKDGSSLKNYYISQKNYSAPDAKFGTKDVISPIPGSTGEDRFYIMALENFTDGTNTRFCWYDAAYDGSAMTDYASTTKTGFGEGKTNTSNMITKWNASGYGTQNDNVTYLDMWGVIQAEVNKGWFVPSKDEWSAFAGELKISKTSSDTAYYGNFGLSDSYWSSSQHNADRAWYATFFNGYMLYSNVSSYFSVRLSATF